MVSNNQVDLVIRMTAVADLKAALKQTKLLTKEYSKLASVMKKTVNQSRNLERSMNRTLTLVVKQSKVANKETESIVNSMRNLQGVAMGLGFTFLFGGMALKNFFQNLWNGIFNTFMLVHGEGSEQQALVNRLSGAWEYLKWSIMNALWQSGIFTWFIESLINIVNWVSKLPNIFKIGFGAGIVAAIALGAVFMIIGQMLLVISSIFSIIGFLASDVGIKMVAGFNAARLAVLSFIQAGWARLIANIKAVGLAMWGWVTAMGKFAIATAVAAAPWLALLGLVVLAIALFISLKNTWDEVLEGYRIKWAMVFTGATITFGKFANWVVDKAIGVVDMMLKMAQAMNATGKFDIDLSVIKRAKSALQDLSATQKAAIDREEMNLAKLASEGAFNALQAKKDFKDTWAEVYDQTVGKFISTSPSDVSTTNQAGNASIVPGQESIANSPWNQAQNQVPQTQVINQYTFETGTIVGDSEAFARQVKEMLEREQLHTFGSPTI
jgi:hypothetical protein